MSRIAVTGAAGFIGSHLTDRLLRDGHHVIAIDNLSMGSRKNFEHNLANPAFEFHLVDVLDYDALSLACGQIDSLVHLAAVKIPRYGHAEKTLLVNVKGSENVLEIARQQGVRLVLASTSDVYGKNPEVPFSETSSSVFGPSTVARWSYAVSKLFDEQLAFAYRDSYGLPVVILRFFGSYGPRHHRSWWGGPQSVFIDAVLEGTEIEIHGDGQQTRSFIYIDDLIDGIVQTIVSDKAPGEIFNLGAVHEITIADLANTIHRLSGADGPLKCRLVGYASFGRGYEDVRRRVPDITKARTLLGFDPRVTLEDGLRRTIEWHREIGPRMIETPPGAVVTETVP